MYNELNGFSFDRINLFLLVITLIGLILWMPAEGIKAYRKQKTGLPTI